MPSVKKFKIAIAKGGATDVSPVNKRLTLDELVTYLTSSFPVRTNKINSPYFVGGHFFKDPTTGKTRRDNRFIVQRSMITIDVDEFTDYENFIYGYLPFEVPFKTIVYSTYSHTDEKPKLRLVIPLSFDIPPLAYPSTAAILADEFTKHGAVIDPSSYKVTQAMFLPQIAHADAPYFAEVFGDELYVPPSIDFVAPSTTITTTPPVAGQVATTKAELVEWSDEDFSSWALPDAPKEQNFSVYQIKTDLKILSEQKKQDERNAWIQTGQALHSHFAGSPFGLKLWDDWSKESEKYKEGECQRLWTRSFKLKANGITFATIHKIAQSSINGDIKQRQSIEMHKINEIDEYADPIAQYVYIAGLKRMYQVIHKSSMDVEAFNRKFRTHQGYHKYNIDIQNPSDEEKANGKKPGKPYTQPFNYAQDFHNLSTVQGELYFPAGERCVIFNGEPHINTYQAFPLPCCARLEVNQAAINAFVYHWTKLIPNPREYQIFMDFLAHVIQNPGKRIGWALLLQSCHGTGKTLLFNMLQGLMGKLNTKEITSAHINSDWTDWAVGGLVTIIDEIYVPGAQKFSTLDRLKPIVSNDTIAVNKRNVGKQEHPNFSSYIAFTNHRDAIPIDDNDRRWCPIFMAAQSKEQLFDLFGGGSQEACDAYFANLVDTIADNLDSIGYYFANWKISKAFNPKGRAPITDAKLDMIKSAESNGVSTLRELIMKYENISPDISEKVLDITKLRDVVTADGEYTNQKDIQDFVNHHRNKLLTSYLKDINLYQKEVIRVQYNHKNLVHTVYFSSTLSREEIATRVGEIKSRMIGDAANNVVDFI